MFIAILSCYTLYINGPVATTCLLFEDAMAVRQKAHEDYTVAWVCALALEDAAASAMLEKAILSSPSLQVTTRHMCASHEQILLSCERPVNSQVLT